MHPLHYGFVPTLRDLLAPPAHRPREFRRGYDVYDPVKVGFVATGRMAEKHGVLYDPQALAGGNSGHDFATNIPDADKEALVEYLKIV